MPVEQSAEAICNLALDKLGAEPISNLAAPVKPNEKLLSRQYPHWRDSELRRHRWLFSIATVRLTPTGDPTSVGYDAPMYQYQMPNAALRAIRRVDDTWRIENGRVLLDPSTTYIDVAFVMQRAPGDMDVLFQEVLACRLAFECCEKITQSNEKKKDLWQLYKEAIDEAKRANAFERGPEAWIEQDTNTQYTWEQARNL